MNKRTHITFLAFLAIAVLAACTTVDIGPPPTVERGAKWALLPVANHTETPQAGLRAEVILDGVLRANGVRDLARYPARRPRPTNAVRPSAIARQTNSPD